MPLTREQAAEAIIAVGDEARRAHGDAAWMRRNRHGDPTALTELGERACLRLALSPKEFAATLRADPKLAALMQHTIAAALADAEQADAPARRVRLALFVGLPLAVAVCVGAYLAYQSYQDSPEVRRAAARAAAAKAAGQPAPPAP